jgi:heptosyltransferase-2
MGLAHLAPAVGTRTIVLFGPTNPVTTRPLSELAEVIRVDVECSPCMLRECPIDHRCMTRITVDRVFESAINALRTND